MKTLARVISYLFNPILLLVFVPFILLYRTTNEFSIAAFWTGYTLIFLIAIGAYMLYEVKKGRFTDLDVYKREQRPVLFVMCIIFTVLYMLGLWLLKGPFPLFVVAVGVVVGIILASIINMWIKASLHMATLAALIFSISVVYGGWYSLLLLLFPLVAWARLRLKRHTMQEVIVGGIFGSLLSLIMYILVKWGFH